MSTAHTCTEMMHMGLRVAVSFGEGGTGREEKDEGQASDGSAMFHLLKNMM